MDTMIIFPAVTLLLRLDISDGFRIHIQSAVPDCTFTVYNGYALYGHNDLTYPDTSVDTCKQMCLSNTRCLSMDVNHNTNACFLSYSSKDTQPNAYGRHTSSTYFQKVCGDPDSEDDDNEQGSGDNNNREILGSQCLKKIGPFGGNGGSSFSDINYYEDGKAAVGFQVRYGRFIDCIGLQYPGKEAPCHGGTGGSLEMIAFSPGEVITSIRGRVGRLFDQISFTTTHRSYGPYGSSLGGKAFAAHGSGSLAYISGRAGALVDQISFHFLANDC